MAKVFITGFAPSERGFMGVTGFLDNRTTGVYTPFTSTNIPYDTALAASMRQQVLDNAPAHINESISNAGFASEAVVVPSDIEYIS